MDVMLVPKDELMHYGVKGMKWGVRRYQNKDGTLTAKGQKKLQKNEAYRNKMAAKAQKKANKFKAKADEANYNVEDLKRRGVRSDAYKKWKEEQYEKREWEYETDSKNKITDANGDTYVKRYSRSPERFADDIFDGVFRGTTVKQLIDDNYLEARRNTDSAKRWMSNKSNLMNMEVSALTKKKEIRRVYRG